MITRLHLHTPMNRRPIWFLPGRLLIFYGALSGQLSASADEGSAHQSPQLVTRHSVLLMGRKVGEQLTSPLPGIPAAKVLQLATIGAARVMRKEGELGSLEPVSWQISLWWKEIPLRIFPLFGKLISSSKTERSSTSALFKVNLALSRSRINQTSPLVCMVKPIS